VKPDSVAIIGAGPYGLSIAAHLAQRHIPTVVFGRTMEFWRKMPDGMHLKSVWSASSLSDPDGKYNLNRYVAVNGVPASDPIPLPYFCDYGEWFQRQAVPQVDPTYVTSLSRDNGGFRLELADGRSASASKVVTAVGIESFAEVPAYARHLPPELATHSQVHKDFDRFRGRTVAVLGRGQSAVQTAAFLHEAGAEVELIARGDVIWIQRKLYRLTGPAKHIFYPSSDVGPPGLNWFIHYPLVFRRLPEQVRFRVEQRAIRPAGAPWLRHRVEGVVRITTGVEIAAAKPVGDALHLKLSDGTTRTVDHLFLCTGYAARLESIAFLAPELREDIRHHDGLPELSSWFESSVPNLYFAGAIASYNFGPLCRFVAGARASGQQISRHVAADFRRGAYAVEPAIERAEAMVDITRA
jgi:FAD-dependent urate hydroxylase